MLKKIIAIAFISLFSTSFAYAHSGGTDKNGCHAGSKPYHCH
ncbi:YHYH domain-containing protein [Pollutimonas sp. H1-120]